MNNMFIDRFKRAVSVIEAHMSVSVGTKLLVPFFIVMLLVVASLSYLVVDKISEKVEQMEKRRAVNVLESTFQDVEKELETARTYAGLLGDSRELEEAVEKGDTKKIYKIVAAAKQTARQQRVMLFDRNGRLMAETADSHRIHEEAVFLIRKGLQGITTSAFAVSTDGLEIYAVAPVASGFGAQANSPVLLIDRHIGKGELEAIKKREGVEITIISGNKVAASTLGSPVADRILRDISGVSSAKKPVFTRIFANDTDYINVWRPAGGGLILVTVPNNDLQAIKQGLSEDIVRTTFIAMLLVFLCAFVMARVLVGPLRKMLQITKAITQGDFTQKIEVITRDEFGELGDAINLMAEKIKQRLDQAEYLATVDGLTGLYNHRYFQQHLAQEISRSERTGLALSLILIDIDYFKQYNDILGHPAGDKVLRQIGKILYSSVRSVDIAARYGGEEFAVILVDTGAADAFEVAERIRRAVGEYPFEGRENQPTGNVTVSMGIASYPENARNKEELIKLADDALYQAKFISKNKVVLA